MIAHLLRQRQHARRIVAGGRQVAGDEVILAYKVRSANIPELGTGGGGHALTVADNERFDRHPIILEFMIFIVAVLPSAKIAKSRTTRPLQSI
jgi:hypothetical protein